MIAWWNHFCQVVGDALLGWLIRLHSDATLLVLALLSAVVFSKINRRERDTVVPVLHADAEDGGGTLTES